MKGLAKILNRALASVSMRLHVVSANLWRDSYNPLRGLTITRAVSHLEAGERGAYAELQWLYRYIEMQDATLGALIERRTSAVQEMGWDVKVPEGLEGAELTLAEKQAEALREAYNGISNLKEAIEFLCMASFRGFSHLEVIQESGAITELVPVEQWYWCRNGMNGDWKYNADSKFGVTDGEEIGERLFIVREVARPINRVALVAFIRKSMSQKDWDGFIETFGIPAVFIIAPQDVPKEKEAEYQEVAEAIASDARGVLPGGSDVKTVDNGARGTNPFLEHIKYQDEQVVLRGTGGKLTMLAESGSGTLAGNAHRDTFDQVARAEACEISELLREVVDAAVLEEKFPGQKQLAYFEIAANEETDTKAVVTEIAILSKAGYKVPADQVKERTGYEVAGVESLHSSRPAGAPSSAGGLIENAVRNRGGWRTLDDGRRVYIDELRDSDPAEERGVNAMRTAYELKKKLWEMPFAKRAKNALDQFGKRKNVSDVEDELARTPLMDVRPDEDFEESFKRRFRDHLERHEDEPSFDEKAWRKSFRSMRSFLTNRERLTDDAFQEEALEMLHGAREADMQGLGNGLAELLQEENLDVLRERLAELDGRLPEMLGGDRSADAWESILASALVNGFASTDAERQDARIENGDKPGHPYRGNQWVSAAPGLVTVDEADEKLAAGYEVESASGEKISFDARLKAKLDRQPDGDNRKARLLWAEETVRKGRRHELTVNGERRTYYGRVFKDKTTDKGILVIVDTEDGYAFNFHPIKPHKLEKKMKNRLGSGEQPPPEVLKAYAAAGNHEGLRH